MGLLADAQGKRPAQAELQPVTAPVGHPSQHQRRAEKRMRVILPLEQKPPRVPQIRLSPRNEKERIQIDVEGWIYRLRR